MITSYKKKGGKSRVLHRAGLIVMKNNQVFFSQDKFSFIKDFQPFCDSLCNTSGASAEWTVWCMCMELACNNCELYNWFLFRLEEKLGILWVMILELCYYDTLSIMLMTKFLILWICIYIYIYVGYTLGHMYVCLCRCARSRR